MARSNEMIEKIDNRELAPASQPADLSQSGVTPDSYYRDQAEDRAASSPDDAAPRAGDVGTAADVSTSPLPASSDQGGPMPLPDDVSRSDAVSADGAEQSELGLDIRAGVTTSDGDGGSSHHDMSLGADFDTDTTISSLGRSEVQGSGGSPDLLQGPVDVATVEPAAPEGLASLDMVSLAPVVAAVGGLTDTITPVVSSTAGVVDQSVGTVTSTVMEAVEGLSTAAADNVGGDLLQTVADGSLLGGLFDPGDDDSGLDQILSGSDDTVDQLADVVTTDVGDSLLDTGNSETGGGILGLDDFDDGLSGLL